MYTLPEPSNGAPTAMSGKEREFRVTPVTMGPTVFQPCAAGHRAQHGVTSLSSSAQSIREQSSVTED